jgi:hypothetical protein
MLVFYRENKESELCAVYFKGRMEDYKRWREKHNAFLIVGKKFA